MCEKGQLIAPFLLEIDIFPFFFVNDVQVAELLADILGKQICCIDNSIL